MKTARLLGAWVCAAILPGCVSPTVVDRPRPPLYLHFGLYRDAPARLLSTRVDPGTPFLVGAGLAAELTGVVQDQGEEFLADVQAGDGVQFTDYRGAIQLERPFFPTGGASSGGADTLWFVVSTNTGWESSIERIRRELLETGWLVE